MNFLLNTARITDYRLNQFLLKNRLHSVIHIELNFNSSWNLKQSNGLQLKMDK